MFLCLKCWNRKGRTTTTSGLEVRRVRAGGAIKLMQLVGEEEVSKHRGRVLSQLYIVCSTYMCSMNCNSPWENRRLRVIRKIHLISFHPWTGLGAGFFFGLVEPRTVQNSQQCLLCDQIYSLVIHVNFVILFFFQIRWISLICSSSSKYSMSRTVSNYAMQSPPSPSP